jgi:DNA-binding NtrC family response regulator
MPAALNQINATAQAASEAFMKTRLLWADADTSFTEICEEYCTRCGFHAETAAGGIECLQKLHHFRPEVLILDFDLPWGGADGVLALLDRVSARRDLRVVLATGSESSARLARRTGLPEGHCLPKPFRLETVLDRIRSAVTESTAPGGGSAYCGA